MSSVCQLQSCFLCGIETGLFVSDRSLYLMEVIAQPGGQLPWRSKSLPLKVIVEASLHASITGSPHGTMSCSLTPVAKV